MHAVTLRVGSKAVVWTSPERAHDFTVKALQVNGRDVHWSPWQQCNGRALEGAVVVTLRLRCSGPSRLTISAANASARRATVRVAYSAS